MSYNRNFARVNLIILLSIGSLSTGETSQKPLFQDKIDSTLVEIIDQIYRENYDAADSISHTLISRFPDHPAGYFMLAVISISEGLFLKDYDKYYDTSFEWLDKAINRANKWIKQDQHEARAFFFAGGAHGYEAAIHARRKSWIKTGFSALRGIRYLERAQELDPTLADINFGLGLYHVVAGNQEGIVKFLQKLLPIPAGDAELGVELLNIARERGNFTRLAAISSLAFSYVHFDKEYQKAIELLDHILESYPDNLEFHTMKTNATFYATLNDTSASTHALGEALAATRHQIDSRNISFYQWWLDKFSFMEGYVLFLDNRLGEAGDRLSSYCRKYNKKGASYLTALGYLTLGKIADLRGERLNATLAYRKVRNYETMGNEEDLAEKLLAEQYSGEDSETRFRGGMTDVPDRP